MHSDIHRTHDVGKYSRAAVVHLEEVNDCEWTAAGTEPRVPYVV